MKKLLLCLFVLIPVLASALTLKETRVYYLDCTGSMLGNKAKNGKILSEEVPSKLKEAIRKVDNESTELIVVPFGATIKTPFKQFATEEGKEKLCAYIDNLSFNEGYTNFYEPLTDFYRTRVNPNRITYLFLMTDGEDNRQKSEFRNILKEWGQRFGEKHVYGFYVMLCDEARSKDISDIIETQPHLWKVETADININIIRLETDPVFNVRNDKYAYCTIQGDVSKGNLKVELDNNQYYQIQDIKVERSKDEGDRLRLEIVPTSGQTQSTLPKDVKLRLSASMTGAGEYTFLVTDKITLKCLNEKEFVVTVPKQINGKTSFYPPFLGIDGKRVPIETNLNFEFSDDAKAEPSCFAEFTFVDKDGKIIPQNEVTVYVDGEKTSNNTFHVNSREGNKKIKFEFGPDFKRGKHQGYLKLTKHNLDRINNYPLTQGETSDDVVWTIRYHEKMNPLAEILMWLGIAIAAFLFIWFAFIRPAIYPHFGKMTKNVLIKQNGKITKQYKVVFTRKRTVYFANNKVKQSWLKTLFVGKIVTLIDPIFVDQLKFMPRRKDAMALGLNYMVTPNPIPRSGVANIKNAKQNFEITLN